MQYEHLISLEHVPRKVRGFFAAQLLCSSIQVRAIVEPRVKTLLDIVELFLTRIVAVRGQLPYGIRAVARRVYDAATVSARMRFMHSFSLSQSPRISHTEGCPNLNCVGILTDRRLFSS